MATPSELALIEKIVRAKVTLEKSHVEHKGSCPVECDPEGYAPCSCGASSTNSAIDAALKELKL